MPGLTLKQRLFVEAYLGEANGNATKAARIAGYGQPRQAGSRMLSNVDIRELVNKRVTQAGMDANRVLAMVSAIAEKSDIVADQLRALKWMGDHYGLWSPHSVAAAAARAAELARAEQASASDQALVSRIVDDYGLSPEAAAGLVKDLFTTYEDEQSKDWSLTDELRFRVLGSPSPPQVSLARKDEIIREVLERHGLAAVAQI